MVVRRLLRNPRLQNFLLDQLEDFLREPGEDNDIQPGLVPVENFNLPFTNIEIPVGDKGLYITPAEPADPTDCARWPDSPFCGGIPFTTTPIGLDPEIINDGCNIGVRLNPAMGFIRLPPVALVYRKPECRVTPPLIDKPTPSTIRVKPNCYGGRVTIGFSGTAISQNINVENFDTAVPSTKYPFINDPGGYISLYDLSSHITIDNFQEEVIFELTQKRFSLWLGSGTNSFVETPSHSIEKPQYDIWYQPFKTEPFKVDYDKILLTWFDDFKIDYVYCSLPSPPPPPPKEICCMPQCCPPPDDALLKLLLKKVNKLSEAIGVEELPAALPKRIIYPNGKGEEKPKNIVEILGYQVKQIDRAVGLLPQKIKVADTNPGLAGNQSVEVEIHSFADFAKEILQLLLDTEGDVDTTNNMLVRVLYELGFIHQGVVQGDAMLDAIVEFLDFKQKWKKISIPFAFDPHAGTKGKVGQGFDKQKNTSGDGPQTEEEVERLLPALLQNTEVDIRILVNDEKKSLSDILNDIKRDTAIAAAAVSENADSGKLDQLVAAAQLLLQLEGAIDRKNIRQALTSGNLRTAKNNGT